MPLRKPSAQMQTTIRIFLKGDVNISGTNLRVFSYAQLDAATNNLRRDMMVARGVFSFVHEGWQKKKIPLIGIKKSVIVIKKLSAGSWQGGIIRCNKERVLRKMVDVGSLEKLTIGQTYTNSLKGRNSYFIHIRRKGSTKQGSSSYLVHPAFLYFDREGSIQPLPWNIRLNVAVGIAQGLAYLHSPEVLVIHRDLRSSNMLPDKFYNAKISDFGLASVLSPDDSRVETHDGHV
ncbi:hypothetical protein NC651_039123 [Populus alba x Populus x berolinensis]|nr:hypothetical protein NC651_039123 [Populus alba x Populus x berolinensis]